MAYEYTSWAYSLEIPGAGRKFVLVALADAANADGHSFPGQKRLATMTGQSERTVRQHLEWLEEHGYVRREERRRKDGTRTSDAYHLPPIDSSGRIRRLIPSGESRRLMEEAETPDQDADTPTPSTGESRRLSAPRSTGNLRTGHRQISPVDAEPTSAPSSTAQTPGYQPADFAGHEPLNHQKEPPPSSSSGSSNAPKPEPAEEEEADPVLASEDSESEPLDLTASQASVYRNGPGRGQTDSHLPTLHPAVFKQLVTFRKLHGPKATDEMFRAWAAKIRHHISDHGEPRVLEALEATIGNFAALKFPFSFYEACLKRKPRADRELADADDFKKPVNAADLLGTGRL